MPAPAGRRAYPSDLTDAQWAVLEPRLREFSADGPGRPPTVDLREVVNALLYIKQTGCPWRYVPHDLPPRSTVHYYFEKWTADGTLETLLRTLREQLRQRARHEPLAGAGGDADGRADFPRAFACSSLAEEFDASRDREGAFPAGKRRSLTLAARIGPFD